MLLHISSCHAQLCCCSLHGQACLPGPITMSCDMLCRPPAMPPGSLPGPPAAGGYNTGSYQPSGGRPPMQPQAAAAAGGPARQQSRPAANGVPQNQVGGAWDHADLHACVTWQ
jgi:hypothetical protein